MTFGHILALTIIGLSAAGCNVALPFDDPFEQNLARSQTVTASAGNAEKSNEAIQIIDPWPRYVYDTHIPGDGQRLAAAVERYKDVTQLKSAAKPMSPLYDVSGGTTTTSGTNQ